MTDVTEDQNPARVKSLSALVLDSAHFGKERHMIATTRRAGVAGHLFLPADLILPRTPTPFPSSGRNMMPAAIRAS